ncbi:DUF2284 domain-containing protein [Thermococcus aciditolerans]|uniref:DUF2284 domain-containing protein n=1 Tax=Thermococcus aciditolerans TaxID=2598455 RepID=A0A5C0SJD0_9EURY|nr:DUF2284 domain-containing protein [Thermococcus aciditolerans]QEK14370.1 DUF2284 domain-containing protein [Thermococcus aciditolerans]
MRVLWEREIPADEIVVSPRPVWKCRSCPMYGRRPSCPPHVPDWREAREWVRHFKRALIVKFEIDMERFEEEKREALLYLLKREGEFFKKGKMYAMALFPGSCNLCDDCPFERGKPCRMPTKVRPSIDAIGIEIGKLVEINFSESVLYGMVLIE